MQCTNPCFCYVFVCVCSSCEICMDQVNLIPQFSMMVFICGKSPWNQYLCPSCYCALYRYGRIVCIFKCCRTTESRGKAEYLTHCVWIMRQPFPALYAEGMYTVFLSGVWPVWPMGRPTSCYCFYTTARTSSDDQVWVTKWGMGGYVFMRSVTIFHLHYTYTMLLCA